MRAFVERAQRLRYRLLANSGREEVAGLGKDDNTSRENLQKEGYQSQGRA